MRFALIATAAMSVLLAGCDRADAPSGEAPPAATAERPAGNLQPRVNLAPVAPAKVKAVMHERHEGMERVGKLMKQLSRDMKAEPVKLAAVRPAAAEMNRLAQKAANWFPAGTGPSAGKTGAKDEIWQKPQDFAAKMTDFQKAAAALDAAARSGNQAAAKSAFGELGKSCKGCHESYRSKMKH